MPSHCFISTKIAMMNPRNYYNDLIFQYNLTRSIAVRHIAYQLSSEFDYGLLRFPQDKGCYWRGCLLIPPDPTSGLSRYPFIGFMRLITAR